MLAVPEQHRTQNRDKLCYCLGGITSRAPVEVFTAISLSSLHHLALGIDLH